MYCPAAFQNLRLDSNGSQVLFRPCCAYSGSQVITNLADYHVSAEIQAVRDSAQDPDAWPSGCSKCQQQENLGLESLRQIWLKRWPQPIQHTVIEHLEILPSNVCNLRCYMCDADHSTAVAQEQHRLGWIPIQSEIDNVDVCLETLRMMPNLRSVSFIGGEFFLNRRSVEILDAIVHRGLSIELTTNATVIRQEHMQCLMKLHDVNIQISIDGIDAGYEFMRYPARWKAVTDNIDLMREFLPQARFTTIMVVQALNLHHMIPVMEWCNRQRMPLLIHDIVNPAWLQVDVFDHMERSVLIDLLDKQLTTAPLLTHQRHTATQYQRRLAEKAAHSRSEFIQRMHAMIRSRRMPDQQIRQQLYPFPDLATAILAGIDTDRDAT